MKIFAVALVWVLYCLTAVAVNLTPCPDCEQKVSPRAVMCPHCGCPGDAIREAYEALKAEEEGPLPLPVIQMVSEHARTVAVALRSDDAQYLLTDLWAIGATTHLGFQTLSTGDSVTYRSMQIARDAPLVRFSADHTGLAYLERSPTPGADPSAWLDARGQIIEQGDAPPDAVAALDQDHRILFVLLHENGETTRYPVPTGDAWMDAAPGVFRAQMSLLLGARNTTGALPDEMRSTLRQTPWLSPFLKNTAHRLAERGEENSR